MVQGIENYEREKALYDGIVMEYLELEDIVRNQSNTGGPYQSTLHTALPKALAYLEWWWKCALRGPVLRCVCCNAAVPARPVYSVKYIRPIYRSVRAHCTVQLHMGIWGL